MQLMGRDGKLMVEEVHSEIKWDRRRLKTLVHDEGIPSSWRQVLRRHPSSWLIMKMLKQIQTQQITTNSAFFQSQSLFELYLNHLTQSSSLGALPSFLIKVDRDYSYNLSNSTYAPLNRLVLGLYVINNLHPRFYSALFELTTQSFSRTVIISYHPHQ